MAKKKKKKGTSRRVSGLLSLSPSSPLMMYGPILAGYFLGDKINEAITKAVGDKIDGKMIAGAEVGLGALLVFKKGKKSLLTNIAGGLLLGAGIKKGMTEFGLGGFQNVPGVSGFQDVQYVNGPGRRKRMDRGGSYNGFASYVHEAVGNGSGLSNRGSGMMQ